MAYVLRTFTEPTDVYISGDYYGDTKEAFGVTDDESGFTVTNGDDSVGLNGLGFGYIFTREEFRAAIPKLEDPESDYPWDGVYLKDFVGEIKLELRSEDSLPEKGIKRGQDILSDSFDPNDYALYQWAEHAGDIQDINGYKYKRCYVNRDVVVVLPQGATMSERLDTKELIEILELSNESKVSG